MIKNRHNTLAVILVLIFGFALFYNGTDGFRAFTEETARLNELNENKPQFPDVTLEDSKGQTYSFSEFKDQYVLITFLYTACTSVCPQLEMNMAEVYKKIPKEYLGKDITFLSISFDPARDDPATLDKYKDYFKADGKTWRMARITDKAELDALLQAFGVIVIPDGFGNFTHNSAFYLVDRDGRLAQVMDYKKTDEAAHTVVGILEKGE